MKEVKPVKARFFHFSLRYKVALSVFIVVSVMSFLLFHTTFQFVRGLVLERNEQRLLSVAEVFTESLKVPLVLNNEQVLAANVEWMANRADVMEVRVESETGKVIGSTPARGKYVIPPPPRQGFRGVLRLRVDRYAVSVPVEVGGDLLGRLVIVFNQMGFEEELRAIFNERMRLAFFLGIVLVFVTAGVTWIFLRPLLELKQTVQRILAGDLNARAEIRTGDEIEDLAGAFNEMLSRLSKTLENLRARTQALEESEEKYRLIVDNASDIILALDSRGGVVFLNEGFSGCSREDLMLKGQPLIRSLMDEASRDRFDQALEEVRNYQKSVRNLSSTHRHAVNQGEIHYLINLTPLVDHEGHVKFVQGVMRDVTELRRIEMMKESLVRDVAHELKTPTAKFEMAVNWIEKEIQKEDALRKYEPLVEILKTNVDRLMRTITSIMDLSRLESGMDKIVKESLDLNEILGQVRRDMEPLCLQKGLLLDAKLAPEPLMVQGDRDMLYRLFVNLITNAIKFTPQGRIDLASRREGSHALASVTDTGIGLSPGDREIIFERFVQKTASSQGIGVGLTICRDIAALHDARIWADSPGPGRGSVFKVEFT